MSRREYKTINRRLQRGRLASVKEGKFVGNKAPYGYKRVRLETQKGWTLEPDEEEAKIIRLIFEWYTKGELQEDGTYKRLGLGLIVRRLNKMKVLPRMGGDWVGASVRDILINPVYIGKVRWNWRPAQKKMLDGQVVIQRPRSSVADCIIADGLHPAIIDEKVFHMTQEFMKQNPPRPVGERYTVKNPLAGVVVCGKCGRSMARRPHDVKNKSDTLMCPVTSCDNISSALHFVEEKILEALAEWLGDYKSKWENPGETERVSQVEVKQKVLKDLNVECGELDKQLDNIHTQLERGVYSTEQFLERSRLISERITQTKEMMVVVEGELQRAIAWEDSRRNIIPKVEKLLAVYDTLSSPKAKNDMLKDVLEKVVYLKEKNGRWHNQPNDFEVELFPRLPVVTVDKFREKEK